VHLGDIPFVRLREGLPKRLLEGGARFSEAVAEAQKALPPLSLLLDPATRTVTAGGEGLVLERAQFAFYWMMAERCIMARGQPRAKACACSTARRARLPTSGPQACGL
jgi:hypothetical protein